MKTFFFTILFFFTTFLVIKVFVHSVGENPIQLKQKGKSSITNLFPQGWSFFTKEPPQYRYTIYTLDKDNNFQKLETYNAISKNLYGLKKSNRLLPHFIENNMGKIKSKFWFESNLSIENIELDSLNTYKLNKPDMNVLSEESLIIELYKINPWLYFSNDIIFDSNKHYIKLNII